MVKWLSNCVGDHLFCMCRTLCAQVRHSPVFALVSRARCCGSFIERSHRNKTLSLKKLPGIYPEAVCGRDLNPQRAPCVVFPYMGIPYVVSSYARAVLPLNYRTTLTRKKFVLYLCSARCVFAFTGWQDVSIVMYFSFQPLPDPAATTLDGVTLLPHVQIQECTM